MSSKSNAPAVMTLVIGRRVFQVKSLAHASARYQKLRGDKSSRVIGGGEVFSADGAHLAHISYNGRVWPPGPWQSGHGGTQPIMEAADESILHVVDDEHERWARTRP